jgi:hypothetical protein
MVQTLWHLVIAAFVQLEPVRNKLLELHWRVNGSSHNTPQIGSSQGGTCRNN